MFLTKKVYVSYLKRYIFLSPQNGSWIYKYRDFVIGHRKGSNLKRNAQRKVEKNDFKCFILMK